MKSIFHPDNKFGQLIIKIGNLIVLSWVWLIFCVPLITIPASCTALYAVIRKVLKDEDENIYADFWRAFRMNFKQATLVGLLVAVVFAIMGSCAILYMYMNDTSLLGRIIFYVFVAIVVLFAVWVQVVFAYIARFVDTTKTVMRNCLLMCMMDFMQVLIIGLLTAAVAYSLYSFDLIMYLPLVLSILPSAYTAVLVSQIEKIFVQYIPKQENEEQ